MHIKNIINIMIQNRDPREFHSPKILFSFLKFWRRILITSKIIFDYQIFFIRAYFPNINSRVYNHGESRNSNENLFLDNFCCILSLPSIMRTSFVDEV